MMVEPIAASTGRASSKSRASPPTMIASVPSSARGTPPDTGASRKRAPRWPTASATRRDTLGSIVDMSMQRRPAPMPSRTPPAPRYADSTCDDEGSTVITRSRSRAAVSWGTSGSVMTVLVDRAAASPLLVGTARLWVAAILLLLAASVTSGPIAVAADDRWRCIAMGACMAVYQAAYFTAVTLSGIAIAALVAICSAPLVIAALAPWLLGERRAMRAPVP